MQTPTLKAVYTLRELNPLTNSEIPNGPIVVYIPSLARALDARRGIIFRDELHGYSKNGHKQLARTSLKLV